MKSVLKSFLAITLFLSGIMSGKIIASNSCTTCSVSTCNSCNASCGDCSTTCNASIPCSCEQSKCKTIFIPRSQGENRVRDYVGQTEYQNIPDAATWNWVGGLAVEFTQNFKRDGLGAYFFPNGTNKITVGPDTSVTTGFPSGNGVDIRNTDLGLSSTFRGTLVINPKIQNVIIEPSINIGFDRWVEGLYLWSKLPMVWSQWDLDCCETITAPGGTTFAPNFMCQSCPDAYTPVAANSITKAFSRSAASNCLAGFCAGRFLCCEQSKFGLADLPLHVGYTFWNHDRGYAGVYARVVFPTGSVKRNGSIFAPRIGYDRWQLGAGFEGSYRFCGCEDEDKNLTLYTDLYVTHMFKKRECRTFDLAANGCFSRYLLMKEFDASGVPTGNVFNVIDKFAGCVESRFDWNLEGLFMLEWAHHNWTIDVGYNVWARDREKFDCYVKFCNPCSSENSLTSCGSCSNSCASCSASGSNSCSTDCSSSSCQSINFNGLQYGIKGGTSANDGDTASLSTISTNAPADTVATTGADQVFINTTDAASLFDLKSGRAPGALSNKVFANAGYNWRDMDYPVFLTVGGEVEFGNHNTALTQWGIFAKAGVSYQ